MLAVRVQIVGLEETALSASARALVREYLTSVYGEIEGCRMREQDAALLLDLASTRASQVALSVHPVEGPVGVLVMHRYEGLNQLCAGYVRERHRGRGLAEAMFRALLEHAALLGIDQVFTVAAEKSPLDVALRSHGLEPSGSPPDGEPGHLRFDLPVPVRHTSAAPSTR